MKNSNKPAFPFVFEDGAVPGLTKREFLAALAMQGFQAANIDNGHQGTMSVEDVAEQSVRQADALLAELETKEGALK